MIAIDKNTHQGSYYEDEEGKFFVSDRRRDFAERYMSNGYNAGEAWFETSNGAVEKKYAYVGANKAMKSPELRRYIKMRQNEIFQSMAISPESVMAEIAKIGFAVKGDEVYSTQYKLKALETLAKTMGLFDKKENNNEPQTITIKLEED